MIKIGIIQNIHKDGIDLFKPNKNFEYEIIDDLSKENLLKKLPLFDGITLRTSKLDADLLNTAKKLKVISRHGVGYDNVDTAYLKQNNISLLITATANAYAVAEHVFYMMLSISKNYLNLDKETRLGHFKKNFEECIHYLAELSLPTALKPGLDICAGYRQSFNQAIRQTNVLSH